MNYKSTVNIAGISAKATAQLGGRNHRLLLNVLLARGSLSRAELARLTGLTPPAIANLISHLLESGLVREAGRRKAARGQPPIAIEIARDGGFAVGIRMDATHYHAVAADLGGEIIKTREGIVPNLSEGGWLTFLTDLYADFTVGYGADRCLGIGLVTPGPFDISWPGVTIPGTIPMMQSRAIASQLSENTGTHVFLENDAYAAALGEKLYGEARGLEDFFYIFIGDGVGAGIVTRGLPYRGHRGNSGEFGHLIVNSSGPLCYCGNRGCLGQYLSLTSMQQSLDEAAKNCEDLGSALDTWIGFAAEALSVGIASVENLFDPEAVILGGTAPPKLLNQLTDALGDLRSSVCQDLGRARLRVSTLGERSAALGASALPILAATSAEQETLATESVVRSPTSNSQNHKSQK